MLQTRPPPANLWTWIGFLTAACVVVGVMGVFVTYAAPLPFERALARSAALSEAVALAAGPDPQGRLDAVRDALGDSAPRVLTGDPAGIGARAAAERTLVFESAGRQAAAVGFRLRLVIMAAAVLAAAFGAGLLAVGRRR